MPGRITGTPRYSVGQTTHLAARMEQMARPDSILITAQRHLDTAIAMYREMGMWFWLEQAQAALGLLGSDASQAEAGP